MKRVLAILAVAVLAAVSVAHVARAAEPEWHSEQPTSATLGIPVPLGQVGGMAFWSPNKGVLIAAGSGGMPAGVYAYDGNGWYLYSTVCGGHEGDIAISGPDEFWTISDYAEAQEGVLSNPIAEYGRTLCHFANGEVVASYAEPAASSEAFPAMKAAACDGPADCWFAGVALREPVPNKDPFHLHWNGSGLVEVPSRVVTEGQVNAIPGNASDLAFVGGRLIESGTEAPYLREVSTFDPRRFLPFETPLAATGPFVLGSEPFGQAAWAVGSNGAVLQLGPTGFEELSTGGPVTWQSGSAGAVGLEPGGGAAWLGAGGLSAEVRQVAGDGTVGPIVNLPQASEELNPKGAAAQISCPGLAQCWMVTSKGWLFHLGGGPAEGANTDPAMHRLITVRPRDASSRSFVEAGLPPDNSGEVEKKAEEAVPREKFPSRPKHPALVVKEKQKMIGETTLQLSFTLRAKAHVQLLAKHHKAVVAKTKRLTLGKGRHRLRLHLDPKRWPTSLDFEVHAIETKATK